MLGPDWASPSGTAFKAVDPVLIRADAKEYEHRAYQRRADGEPLLIGDARGEQP